jgi:hypothetical protein
MELGRHDLSDLAGVFFWKFCRQNDGFCSRASLATQSTVLSLWLTGWNDDSQQTSSRVRPESYLKMIEIILILTQLFKISMYLWYHNSVKRWLSKGIVICFHELASVNVRSLLFYEEQNGTLACLAVIASFSLIFQLSYWVGFFCWSDY